MFKRIFSTLSWDKAIYAIVSMQLARVCILEHHGSSALMWSLHTLQMQSSSPLLLDTCSCAASVNKIQQWNNIDSNVQNYVYHSVNYRVVNC